MTLSGAAPSGPVNSLILEKAVESFRRVYIEYSAPPIAGHLVTYSNYIREESGLLGRGTLRDETMGVGRQPRSQLMLIIQDLFRRTPAPGEKE